MLVVVVDDDPALSRLFAVVLERGGHTVATATTAVEARERCTTMRPDVVTVDMVMPDGSGLDLIRVLRTQAPRPQIVAISGNADLLVAAKEAGADATLSKPFSLAAFLEAVDGLVAF